MTDRSRLRQFIIDYFSDEELSDLTFDYFPEVNRIYASGMTKGQKVRELIDFADRHGRMTHLTTALEKARPEGYCEFFAVEYEEPPALRTHERDPRQIFISFASPDVEFAGRLAASLRETGYEVWVASDSIQPGEKWVDAINRGLMESGIFLLLLTPDAVNSRWVYDETSVAIALENKEQIRILMLRVREADVPPLWSIRQHISFEGDYDRGLNELLAALQADDPRENWPVMAAAKPDDNERDLPALALVIDWPDRPNEERLLEPVTTIGRAADNDIVIDYPFVADHQLRLETQGTGDDRRVRAFDLSGAAGETGATLGGRPMPAGEDHEVEPGDVISLGRHSDTPINLSLRATAGGPAKAAGARPSKRAPAQPVAAGGARPPVWVYGLIGLLVVGVLAFFVLSRGGGDENGARDRATPAEPTSESAAPIALVESPTPEPTAEPTGAPSATPEPSPTAVVAATDTAPPPTAEPTATTEPTAEPTAEPSPTATPTEVPSLDAAIYFTSGATLFAANPEWPAATAIGDTNNNSCFADTITAGGTTHSLEFGSYCDIRGDSAVCPSPDGGREVLVTASGNTRTIEIRRPGGRRGFVFQGPIKISEGIRWSPTSTSYLFVDDRETVYRGLADGGYGTILRSAYAPQYSPDGLQLLFARVGAGGARDVFISNTDGSGATNVSNLGLQAIDCPRWAAP